jgi:hypothetical protein
MNEPEWYQYDGSYILVTESKAPLMPAMVTAVTIAILLVLGLWLLFTFGPESFRKSPQPERSAERSSVAEREAGPLPAASLSSGGLG